MGDLDLDEIPKIGGNKEYNYLYFTKQNTTFGFSFQSKGIFLLNIFNWKIRNTRWYNFAFLSNLFLFLLAFSPPFPHFSLSACSSFSQTLFPAPFPFPRKCILVQLASGVNRCKHHCTSLLSLDEICFQFFVSSATGRCEPSIEVSSPLNFNS